MVNTKIRLIIFFAAKDGEALYSQQKQDQELTVPWIMNSILPNSGLVLDDHSPKKETRKSLGSVPKHDPPRGTIPF